MRLNLGTRPRQSNCGTFPTFIKISLMATALSIVAGCVSAPTQRRDAPAPSSPVPEKTEHDSATSQIRQQYEKREYNIPMRDGVNLFTAVYAPKDQSQEYPMLMVRTPYSIRPYGEDAYRKSLGPSAHFMEEGYIFVFQDVRGCYMSEGTFVNMRPHMDAKSSPSDIDESSDTFDTIEWLLKNIPNNNGRVGMWGISYPGFYAAAGMIDAHPALKAVSPQAPIADWYFDDFHHHGAFFLPHSFNFVASFGWERPEPTKSRSHARFDHGTPDGYSFFLDLGSLANADMRHFHGENPMWNNMVAHPNYDEFWQTRNILPHLSKTAPAVMTVGGWYDAEDLYGPLKIYRSVEQKNPEVFNILVMGPWRHGGWGRSDGDRLGNVTFGNKTSLFYCENIQLPFFNHFLKGIGDCNLPEAYVFETGVNRWRTFDHWPPSGVTAERLYFQDDGVLLFTQAESQGDAFDEFVSDPAKPVPFTEATSRSMTTAYMTDDQRFAARRPDVLVYQTDPLEKDITLAGPILADLWVSTSGTASDWIVKIIDVFPPDAADHDDLPKGRHMGEYQMMVRSEVIRGRYRNSYQHPEPFTPDQPTNIKLELLDVLHNFQEGHRIMVHIQSTWFPLVDRNPHTYADNVFMADETDFTKATQRVYHSSDYPTHLEISTIRTDVD